MKKILMVISVLILFSIPGLIGAQPLLLETMDENNRFMLKLNYPTNTPKSSARIEVKAGLTTFA
ncbi:MAG: hypothetical protein ACI9FN_002405, partial [Saprospiraceae bacterium]